MKLTPLHEQKGHVIMGKNSATTLPDPNLDSSGNVKPVLNKKAVLGIILAVLFMAVFTLIPPPEGMTEAGMASIGIFLAAIALWITEAFPVSISAISLIILMPFFGIMDFNTAVNSFGTSTALFIMATSGITVALAKSTIPLRITAMIVKVTKGNAKLIILGFCLASGILSGIMSSLATCVLFFGFVLVMLRTAHQNPGQSRLGRALMIALPVCSGIGGFLTPAGTPGNVLMMDIMAGYGIDMTFAAWSAVGIPFGLLAILLVAVWLPVVFKPENLDESAQAVIREERSTIGAWTAKEKKSVLIIAAMLILWFAGSWIKPLNTTTVAVLGMMVMFLPGIDILNWKNFSNECNWDLVFIMGTATIIMSGVTATGAMDWIVNLLFANIGSLSPVVMWIVIAIAVCVFRALIPTTTAVIALFAPMLYSIAQMTGANLTAMLMIPAFWGPAAMLLVYTEPIFLITFGERYYSAPDLIKFGWFPSLVMAIIIALVFPIYLPLLGF